MSPSLSPEEPVGSPAWVVLRELDALTRRMDATDRRIDHLDEHGTRGIDALRAQLTALTRDLSEHENLHTEQAHAATASRRWLVGTVLAVVVPLYPMIWAFVGR